MKIIAQAPPRVSGADLAIALLKVLALFCGIGLTVSLMVASYGLDLSPGLF